MCFLGRKKQIEANIYTEVPLFLNQQVTQATNQIVMNCADIDIITASFVPQGGEGKAVLDNVQECCLLSIRHQCA